jgi:hypothetical protein
VVYYNIEKDDDCKFKITFVIYSVVVSLPSESILSKRSKCKTNTLPILMHQMCISTTHVSSVIPRSKKLEIRKKTVKEPSDENHTECHEIESNPSKDRATPEGESPSF